MDKKQYKTPEVKRVKLEIKTAILATCHQSPTIMQPQIGTVPCSTTTGCFSPAAYP